MHSSYFFFFFFEEWNGTPMFHCLSLDSRNSFSSSLNSLRCERTVFKCQFLCSSISMHTLCSIWVLHGQCCLQFWWTTPMQWINPKLWRFGFQKSIPLLMLCSHLFLMCWANWCIIIMGVHLTILNSLYHFLICCTLITPLSYSSSQDHVSNVVAIAHHPQTYFLNIWLTDRLLCHLLCVTLKQVLSLTRKQNAWLMQKLQAKEPYLLNMPYISFGNVCTCSWFTISTFIDKDRIASVAI